MRSILIALLLMTPPALSVAFGQSLVVEKPEFRRLVPDDAVVEKLAGGFQFTEGPAWNAAGGFLVFSDIPADKMYRYNPEAKAAVVFRDPSKHANGNFYDSAGNLYTCEHETRLVIEAHADGKVPRTHDVARFPLTVTELRGEGGGKVEILADRFGDKALNSPNDVIVKSDGTIWFTDPTYGLGKAPKEQAGNNVYCLEPSTERLRAVVTDFDEPNGLCFSPDEKLLYVADSGKPRHVRVFDVTTDHRLVNGRVFCQIDQGVPDGMRCDRHGNLFSTSGDSIQIFAPDGIRLGKILVPETPANLCFGGKEGNELFITAQTSLYRVKLTTTAPGVPDTK